MPGSQRPESRVTSRGETLWCAQFMPKLGKREGWDEQELAEEREGWLVGRPAPGFRGASWTAVASEARRRFFASGISRFPGVAAFRPAGIRRRGRKHRPQTSGYLRKSASSADQKRRCSNRRLIRRSRSWAQMGWPAKADW